MWIDAADRSAPHDKRPAAFGLTLLSKDVPCTRPNHGESRQPDAPDSSGLEKIPPGNSPRLPLIYTVSVLHAGSLHGWRKPLNMWHGLEEDNGITPPSLPTVLRSRCRRSTRRMLPQMVFESSVVHVIRHGYL
jgi:hypothetical protein